METRPDGSQATYSYDGNDNLLTVTDGLNGSEAFVYDPGDRLLQVSSNGQPGETYNYTDNYTGPVNAGGQMTQLLQAHVITYPNGITGTTTFTNGQVSGGRITGIKYTAAGQTLRDFEYGYTAAGVQTDLIQSLTNEAGQQTAYTYDAFNRLTDARQTAGGGSLLHDYQYAYDAANNRHTQTIDGTQTAYAYNPANELQAATTGSQPARTFGYDPAGNQTADSTGPNGAGATALSYNAQSQTTGIVQPGLLGINTLNPTYSGAGQADRTTAAPGTQLRQHRARRHEREQLEHRHPRRRRRTAEQHDRRAKHVRARPRRQPPRPHNRDSGPQRAGPPDRHDNNQLHLRDRHSRISRRRLRPKPRPPNRVHVRPVRQHHLQHPEQRHSALPLPRPIPRPNRPLPRG